MGAFWSVNSHFSTNPDAPALVSLPTGAGKTALMMLLSFGFEPDRVLIVTASDVLRDQTAEKFETLDGLTDAEVVSEDMEPPSVEKITTRMTSDAQWKEIDSDVVVTLPHDISETYDSDNYENNIATLPVEMFDLVFFDEAHHIRAPSWMELLEEFKSTKRVLLTATPFRRDRETLPATLVYHYSLKKAFDRGIYQRIEHRSVDTVHSSNPDEDLAQASKEVLEEIRQQYSDAKLLIRTGSIESADKLPGIYRGVGFSVKPVHSNRTPKQNEETLADLEDDELDGVIAVGMLGEGVDNSDLKVAVLHEPPKSFPFTLQLIGRVTRAIEPEDVSAAVIVDEDELRREGIGETIKRLYHEDRGWDDLIPELVREFVDTLHPDAGVEITGLFRGVNDTDLEPYLSTRLYEVTEEDLDFNSEPDLNEGIDVYRLPSSDPDDLIGFITRHRKHPSWGSRTPLTNIEYNLHLYYYEDLTETLFESTTYDLLAADIRTGILQTEPDTRGGDSLIRVLQSDSPVEYQVAGLANALGPAKSLPSYKMLLGDRVEGAIRPSDPKAFTQGHAVAEINDVTIGMSDGQGTVWSTGRRKLDGWKQWCNGIALKLYQYQDATTAPTLGLGEIRRVKEFSSEPFHGILNPAIYRMDVHFKTDQNMKLSKPTFKKFSLRDDNSKIVDFEFSPNEDEDPIEGSYNVLSNEWNGDITKTSFEMDKEGDIIDMHASQFFDKYPPYFYIGDGELIYDGRSHTVDDEFDELPEECLIGSDLVDWSDCATWVEYDIDDKEDTDVEGLIDVHQWTCDFIRDNGSEDQVIFYDQGSWEIADYVRMDPKSRTISFYHCKKAEKNKASGARIESIQEVLDQVLRTVSWIADSRLPDEMMRRESDTQRSEFVQNNNSFQEIRAEFTPMEWTYEVYIIHPGIDYEDAKSSENINTILLTCVEWLEAAGASFRLIGDPNKQVEAFVS